MPPPNLPVATGSNSLAAGPYAVSSGDNGTAFGYSAVGSGANSSALGSTSVASGANSAAVGMLSRATGANTTAIGNSSTASGNNAAAFGLSSAASGLNTTAIGNQSVASGINSVALGNGSTTSVANTVSFGFVGGERRLINLTAGINPTDGVNVSQLTALDLSVDNRINNAFTTFANWQGSGGISSVAVGNHAIASGPGTIGLGQNAAATGTNSVALGNGASASGANSAAIGAGSVASQPNTISVGAPGAERRIANVAAGVASTDAVNMQQFQSGLAATNAQFGAVNSRIDTVDAQAKRGIAATAALAPMLMPSNNGRTTVSLSSAYYRGEAALSVGVAHRLNLTQPTVVYGSYANGGGSEHLSRLGMAMEF